MPYPLPGEVLRAKHCSGKMCSYAIISGMSDCFQETLLKLAQI